MRTLLLYLEASARCWGFCSLSRTSAVFVRASAVFVSFCCIREPHGDLILIQSPASPTAGCRAWCRVLKQQG